MFTENELKLHFENLREKIQDDLICCLDGFDDVTLNAVCNVVVERCNETLDILLFYNG